MTAEQFIIASAVQLMITTHHYHACLVEFEDDETACGEWADAQQTDIERLDQALKTVGIDVHDPFVRDKWRKGRGFDQAPLRLHGKGDTMTHEPDITLEPRAQVRGRLGRYWVTAQEVYHGLNGKPFEWRGVDAQHQFPLLRQMGITLVSLSAARKRGYELKRGQKPVGRRYFEAPISRWADVYVLECQFKKVVSTPALEATHE